MRLFVGIPVSDAVREDFADYIAELRSRWPHAKWVPLENLHYTVEFIGKVDERAASGIAAALDSALVGIAPFDIEIGTPGLFPARGKARVIWVGARRGEHEMGRVAMATGEALRPWVAPQEKPFLAHLTIARFRVPEKIQDIDMDATKQVARWTVDGVTLYESRLRRPGPLYEPLHVAKLRG